MTAEESLQDLLQFMKTAKKASLLMGAESGDEPDAELDVQRVQLKTTLASEFVEDARSLVDEMADDPVLLEYDPGYKPDAHELCYVKLDAMELVKSIIEDASMMEQVELFDEDEDFIGRLRFYAVVVEGKSDSAIFFHSYSPKKELTQSHWMLLRSYDGIYDRVKRKIFALDEEGQVDCFTFGSYLFVRDVRQFERIFGYLEELTKKAQKTIASVTSHIPISNAEEFERVALADRRMRAKLAQIAGKDYVGSLTIDQLKAVNQKFNLGVRIVKKDGVEKLVFEGSREERWKILNLLDDAYLESPMTELKYEANSKRSI
jgi:hypothetical protein